MVRVLAFIKADAHRNSLHNLHVISRRVLRWQQAEARTRRGANGFHVAVILAAVRIDFDLCTLSNAHVFELCLFEVCRYPDVIQIDDGKYRLARLYNLSWLHVAAAEHAAYRRVDLGGFQVQLRLLPRGT